VRETDGFGLSCVRAWQEEEIRSIFTDDAPKPVGARLDIANTWFVQFTDEDDTKRAFDYVQGKEFKVGGLLSLSMGQKCALERSCAPVLFSSGRPLHVYSAL
jgi:hypothetical protein